MELNKIYNCDCLQGIDKLNEGGGNFCIVTDPPYNVGYHYDEHEDNMPEEEYLGMLKTIIGNRPAVIIHYPETMHKISMAIGRAPYRVVAWVYNSNTPRQHRDIAFYGVKPDFSKVTQPYKNPTDKRIMQRIAEGKTCKMYDWFEQDQIKNVEKERMNVDHPCIIPLEVMDRIIRLLPQELTILDPFCGSGTTCIAAQKNGRKWLGFEKSTHYYELAQRRIKEETAQISLF